MTRFLHVLAAALLLLSGLCFAYFSYSILGSLLEIFFPPLWLWLMLIAGCVASVAAFGLLRWRKISAIAGISAEVVLSVLWLSPPRLTLFSYLTSGILLAIAALVYWRFLHRPRAVDLRAGESVPS